MAEIAILRRVQENRERERRRARRAQRERTHTKVALALAAIGGFMLFVGLRPYFRQSQTDGLWGDEALGI